MHYCALTVALFASLALAQASPVQPLDVPSGVPEHHRHDDDDEAPPDSAANILPDSPVITIEGICDHPSATLSGPGREGTAADMASKDSSAGLSSACKTIVTKAQFEKLVDALNPKMPAPVRLQLAESYPRILVFANKAHELGLDRDPRFAEAMQFASMQLLTESVNRYFEEQASNISDAEVEKYYQANAIKFEREQLLRILVPKQTRQAPKAGSEEHPSPAVVSPMLMVAKKIRVRAAAGDDFQQLQKEAFDAAKIFSGSPNVSTGTIAAVGLPLDHRKVFEMEPGQVSEIIADASGYYIYKVVSKHMVPLAQASKEIRKSMASDRVQEATAALGKSIHSQLDRMYFGASPRAGGFSGQETSKPGDEPSVK